jgi:hypothetical protein
MDDLGFGGGYHAPPKSDPSETVEAAPVVRTVATRTLPTQKVLVGAFVALVFAVAAFYFMVLAKHGGEAVAQDQQTALDTAGQADDVQAELTLRSALTSAETAVAEAGSFTALTPESLKAIEPSFTWTKGASTGPNEISIATTDTAFAAAAMSKSGTCLWVKTTAAGVTTKGEGEPCTGQAAMASAQPA